MLYGLGLNVLTSINQITKVAWQCELWVFNQKTHIYPFMAFVLHPLTFYSFREVINIDLSFDALYGLIHQNVLFK